MPLGKMMKNYTLLWETVSELQKAVIQLQKRVRELEQIKQDRIDEEKMNQFYEDKLGL